MKINQDNLKGATIKKIITLVFTIAWLSGSVCTQGTRYVDEVFTEVVKVSDQLYSENARAMTDVPLDTLLFDLYMPAGDTCMLRPLAIILHTGTFVPRGFIAPTGDKDDYACVRISEGLAKRGYVTASIQYSVGWNPLGEDFARRSSFINAVYRRIGTGAIVAFNAAVLQQEESPMPGS